jgi:hypothetical protein
MLRRRKSARVDTPVSPTLDQRERVTVTDPAHPLFRREFVLAATTGSVAGGHALVVYRGDVLLKVPIRATSLAPAASRPPSSKLSLEAIRDLVRLAVHQGQTSRPAIAEAPAAARTGDDAEPALASSRRATGGEP